MQTKTIKLNPDDFFKKLSTEKNICFFKSTTADGWPTTIGFSASATFRYKSGSRNRFQSFVKRQACKGRKLMGYFSYDLGYELLGLKKTARDDLGLPDIFFYAFENYITFSGNRATLHFTDPVFPHTVTAICERPAPAFPSAESINFRPRITPLQYERAYDKIKSYIFEGDIYQINFTHRLEAQTTLPSRELFMRVMHNNPVDFLAYIEGDGFDILSASPERFVRIEKASIETCPIKGTRPRGKTAHSDLQRKEQLLSNKKEAAELNMITDLLRNDLGRVCEIGSVKVRGNRRVSQCPTVWHTYSRITGTVAAKYSPVEALISMLPGGSITGCPKKRAMEIIDELETTTRSVYTGCIGYIDPDLDLDFNIAIRTIIKKGRRLYLQVGGGIVYDSRKNAEFAETLAKAKSFMNILS